MVTDTELIVIAWVNFLFILCQLWMCQNCLLLILFCFTVHFSLQAITCILYGRWFSSFRCHWLMVFLCLASLVSLIYKWHDFTLLNCMHRPTTQAKNMSDDVGGYKIKASKEEVWVGGCVKQKQNLHPGQRSCPNQKKPTMTSFKWRFQVWLCNVFKYGDIVSFTQAMIFGWIWPSSLTTLSSYNSFTALFMPHLFSADVTLHVIWKFKVAFFLYAY